ncbi:MAG: hypothetical protein L3J59_15865 [Methylococcaceae bacterium]|nr:hypothetical protein [Methylococcaceae bacterium]
MSWTIYLLRIQSNINYSLLDPLSVFYTMNKSLENKIGENVQIKYY